MMFYAYYAHSYLDMPALDGCTDHVLYIYILYRYLAESLSLDHLGYPLGMPYLLLSLVTIL